MDTIALLLERGADPDAQSTERALAPLHIAADPVVTALLIAYGADVNTQNKDGETPIHTASSIEIFTLLLASGADATIRNSGGYTPLHRAVYLDVKEIKLLLEHGADINARTEAGESACDRVKAAIRKLDPSTLPSDIDEIRDLVCP